MSTMKRITHYLRKALHEVDPAMGRVQKVCSIVLCTDGRECSLCSRSFVANERTLRVEYDALTPGLRAWACTDLAGCQARRYAHVKSLKQARRALEQEIERIVKLPWPYRTE